MPRVAMVIQRYLPHVGGAERQIQQLAPCLRARGFDVCVVTRHEKGLSWYESIDDVPVYRMPSIGPKWLAAVTFIVSALYRLIRLRPDLVHAHEILSPSTISVISKQLNGHPVLVKILRGGALGDIFKFKRRWFWKFRFRKLDRTIDAFITISREIDEELASLHVREGKRIFIPNGVDVLRYVPVSVDLKQKLRADLALPLHAFIVVYVGRLVPEKHVDSLLGIWEDIRENLPSAHLLIVGGGPDEQRLREMPVNGVQFTGPVNDAVRYMQASDLFVLPSSTEGLSNSLLEAMSVGLPVLATAVGGTNDVVQHQENGYLIPPNNVDSLKAGLETLMDDDALRFKIGANARQRILRDFSLDSVAERLAALYHELLSTRSIH